MVAERGDPGPKDLGKDLCWMFSPRPVSERRLTDWTRDVPRRARSSWADGQPCGFLDVGGGSSALAGWSAATRRAFGTEVSADIDAAWLMVGEDRAT